MDFSILMFIEEIEKASCHAFHVIILLLVEVFNEILNYYEPLAHGHTVKVLSEFENLLFGDASAFNNNYVFELFLTVVLG